MTIVKSLLNLIKESGDYTLMSVEELELILANIRKQPFLSPEDMNTITIIGAELAKRRGSLIPTPTKGKAKSKNPRRVTPFTRDRR